MYHCKIFVVDRLLVSVGSTNLDNRSFRLNDEANLNVLDRSFAASQVQVLVDDAAKGRQMTLAHWHRRPRRERFADWISGLLRAQF